jgi:hypothetical protein
VRQFIEKSFKKQVKKTMIKSSLYGLSLGGKTPGNEIAAAAKKPCVEVLRTLWIHQPQASAMMHGGYNPARSWP